MPVAARAVWIAKTLASVPELQNRSSWIDGKRSRIASGEVGFVLVGSAEHDAALERAADRVHDHRIGVAVEAGRIFAEEVGVAVPVEVGQVRAFALGPGEREGRVVQDRAGVAARASTDRAEEWRAALLGLSAT